MKVRPIHIFLIILLVFIAIELIYTKLIFSAERSAYIMGAPVRVKVLGMNAPHLAKRGLWEIKRLDRIFSSFNPESEVNLINKLAGEAPLEVSNETLECLREAKRINVLSRRAFDVTLGHPYALYINPVRKWVYLRRKGIKINLGGIGKGYAAESARRLLLKSGAKSGMIDMRSTIAVFGDKEWEIGIQHPRKSDQLIGTVKLKNGQSLATSGDYERGEHIIDPRTGRPAKLCQSVTVIGENAAETDALATAIFVLGPDRGIKLIEAFPGREALIVDIDGNITKSPGFELIEQ